VNGRHRARAALLQGLKTIPVVVDKDNVVEVRALLAKFKQA
jgi:ParB-like chromosome segregation protein Spo0J